MRDVGVARDCGTFECFPIHSRSSSSSVFPELLFFDIPITQQDLSVVVDVVVSLLLVM